MANQKLLSSIPKDGSVGNIAFSVQFCTNPKLPIHPAIWQVVFNSLNLSPAHFLFTLALTVNGCGLLFCQLGYKMTIVKQSFAATRGCAAACPVRQFGLCSWFEAPVSDEIAARSTQTQFAPGAPILRQGEAANRVGIIQTGLVKIVLNDTNGEEHLIQLLYPGEMVGDPFAPEAAFSWQAATQTSLCWMPRAPLAEAIRTSPLAARRHSEAINRLLQEHHFAQAALRSRNAVQKVAHWLFLQLPARRGPANVRMRLILCRRDLASLLEMTVETLCRSLQQLQGKRAILLLAPDMVEICDPIRLRLLAKGYDDERLQETLLAKGWEWGARVLGPKLTARPASDLKPGVVALRAS